MKREAAVVLALGGGFQAYHKQKRDGSIFPEQMPAMAEVAKFCRERQPFCHHAEQVPQIALVYSTEAHYRNVNGLFSRDPSKFRGTLEALVEAQQSVELLSEHHLSGRMAEFPLIIIPEWPYLDAAFHQELLSFVRNGGNLLLIGPRTAALFTTELDVTFEAQPAQTQCYVECDDELLPTQGFVQKVKLGPKASPLGKMHESNDEDSPAWPTASVTTLRKGRIAATYCDFSQGYVKNRNPKARKLLAQLLRELFPKPLVEVTGSPDVDVVVNRINDRLAINLVNTSGPHATEPIIDSITPVGPLSLVIRQDKKPSKVSIEPGAHSVPFDYQSGEIRVTIPKVEIHDIVLIQ